MRLSFFALLGLLPAFGSALAQTNQETRVAAAIKDNKPTVVHLWAPWCSNCKAELKSGGWKEMIETNPDVQFLFVSIWNAGGDGRDVLRAHGLADQPNLKVLADPGPRGEGRIKRFLDLPVSWIPATWIFKGGDLRYALNYGEVRFPVLQQMLADSVSEWSHAPSAPVPAPSP